MNRAARVRLTAEQPPAPRYSVTYYRADALRLGAVADHLLSIVTQAIRRGRHTTTLAVEVGDDTAATAA